MAWGRINVTASGGTSYNYAIAAYTTEEAIPASGNENDIAIVTSAAIPAIDSGGIVWSAAQPALRTNGDAVQSGDVWIPTSYTSNVPFVAVNGIYVYPIGCFQYDGFAWIERVAKVYYDGAWVAMHLYLYYKTNQCVSVTGGWQARSWAQTSAFTPTAPTIVLGSSSFTMSLTGSLRSGVYEVINNIDLTNFTALKLYASTTANNTSKYARFGVTYRSNTYWETGATGVVQITGGTTWTAYNLDVSAMNSSYDVYIGISVGGSASDVSLEASYLMLIP